MTIERQTVGERLAIRLHAAEAAIDLALAETAALTAMLPTARVEAYLSPVTGQRAFEGAAASVGALTQARGHLVQTHNTLAALGRRLGLETLAAGPTDKPDQEPPSASPRRRISSQFHRRADNRVNKTLPTPLSLC